MKQALGIIEINGFLGKDQVMGALMKGGEIAFRGWKQISPNTFAALISGEIVAVKASINAGKSSIKSLGGETIDARIIRLAQDDLEAVLRTLGFSSSTESASEMHALFNSPEANAIKEEICAVGRKLWQRSYVDGNGGNISCRIGENAVLCTPTLLSKADLKPEDICLVDLDGNQLAGALHCTSEIFLHLEIFKSAPEAKSVVHCHPPHATAYAITGCVPPGPIIPEFDVFVGPVAVTPYETPGTRKFAETVRPYAKNHNTILLGNHGIVCWADTPTHAEWCVENLETYCWTLLISHQLGVPCVKIPPEKEQDLLSIKKRLGLPDIRFVLQESGLSEIDEEPGAIALH